MKIYTKKGDEGYTSLLGGDPVSKNHPRIVSYGSVDELNAQLGVALVSLEDPELTAVLQQVQGELFILGAELAALIPSDKMKEGFLKSSHVERLESQIDSWEVQLEPLRQFILPGGSAPAAQLHLARTVCRRAERNLVKLHEQESVRPELVRYLNRLSDWLFVLARLINHRLGAKDLPWKGL